MDNHKLHRLLLQGHFAPSRTIFGFSLHKLCVIQVRFKYWKIGNLISIMCYSEQWTYQGEDVKIHGTRYATLLFSTSWRRRVKLSFKVLLFVISLLEAILFKKFKSRFGSWSWLSFRGLIVRTCEGLGQNNHVQTDQNYLRWLRCEVPILCTFMWKAKEHGLWLQSVENLLHFICKNKRSDSIYIPVLDAWSGLNFNASVHIMLPLQMGISRLTGDSCTQCRWRYLFSFVEAMISTRW